jgi:transposase
MTFGLLSPEDLVGLDHPVRQVWKVLEHLDLSRFGKDIRAKQGSPGRDATDPQLLVGLWLWACVDGEFSAREVARLCERDAVYQWLCGTVTVNHRLLSDFRTDHADALDELFTQVLSILTHKGLVQVRRISQDGMKVRASAGASSFRREPTLRQRQLEAQEHVQRLRELFADSERSAGISARHKAMQKRAADERARRLAEAITMVQERQKQQTESGRSMSAKQRGQQQRPPRASATDPQAVRMKMSDGGFRPAYNVQLAADTASRAILAVAVSASGTDYHHDQPIRQQIKRRTGQTPNEHLLDGGYFTKEMVDRAAEEQVSVYVPLKPPRNAEKNGDEFTPRAGDSEAMKQLRQRMGSEAGKEIYEQRASTSETINADLRCHRGLRGLTVRGLKKLTCIALWSALAYNVMHFAGALSG